MGTSPSKPNYNDALNLCKERMKYIKQAIDCRNELSAAHLSYMQSLNSLGAALQTFVEAEILFESTQSHSDVEKTPSHSLYASPSPSRFPEPAGSPSLSGSPLSPRLSNMSYMRTARTNDMTVIVDSSTTHFVEDDSLTFPLPPPPPPFLEMGSSWDFFDPCSVAINIGSRKREIDHNLNLSRISGVKQLNEAEVMPLIGEDMMKCPKAMEVKDDKVGLHTENEGSSVNLLPEKNSDDGGLKLGSTYPVDSVIGATTLEKCGSKAESSKIQKHICTETEDASEFITHRAKDFLSSMRDISHHFLQAAESGTEVSRMLETNKIRLGVSTEITGSPQASLILLTLNQLCCKVEASGIHQESMQNMTKVITWKRSVSSLSSLSKNQLLSAVKEDAVDSGSDFIEEYAMISGSHSSTLDRLHAWETKLYEEIKASEHIRKAYDQRCSQLRNQFARDAGPKLIDKTRAVVKDLHSRVVVAIQTIDSISKRIEKMRDEELLPQLVELVQGMIRMWKAMLECHYLQCIRISLAYLPKSSPSATTGEPYKRAMLHLRTEMEYFGQSFSSWVNAHKSYIEALNSWLHKCILQPQERKKNKKSHSQGPSPPPIFVLCSVWLNGLKSLPSEKLRTSIDSVVSILEESFKQSMEEKKTVNISNEAVNGDVIDKKEDCNSERNSNLRSLQSGLTKLFECMKKFSEDSLKVHEDVKRSHEVPITYTNAGLYR